MITTQVAVEPRSVQTAEPIRLGLPLTLALWSVAGAALVGWLTLAALHVDDDYRVTHLQGAWIAVSEAARTGRFYPAAFDGEHYAGTRWMPVPILLNAAGAALVGDPLVGGKLVAAVLMAILLALIVTVLRRESCPWPLAAGLAAVAVTTETGLQAGTTIGGDILAVVLQVGALAIALRDRGRAAMVIAGVLAGLAIASKLNGLWALFAIASWLAVQRRWRAAMVFGASSAATAGLILGAVQLLTEGGLSHHLAAFSAAGVSGAKSLIRAPNQVLYNLVGFATGTVVLAPLALVSVLLVSSWRKLSLIHVAFGWALLLLLGVYADTGTGYNQLIDVVTLTTLAVGHLIARAGRIDDSRGARLVATIVAVTVIWAAGVGVVRTVAFDLRRAPDGSEVGGRAARAVAAIVKPGERVLAEDPSIDVALGRPPIVMDPYMLTRIDRAHPEWVDPLIARIEQRQFDLVVLVVSLQNPAVDYWWTDYHLGPRVANALRRSYRPAGKIGRYHLYRPMNHSASPATRTGDAAPEVAESSSPTGAAGLQR